ncbi:hypothetical protein [Alkaliphilus serpentinus]|uniref:Uncharacterized protein n=1 Tax=Alkaliphilus serpentinus TaxID=1482731 RepID=A0A833HKZ1_9FIRM|nr:hypothetical protein [Alkaliphilus serpentinus]KAB3524432.1 hypothetical protein F8153_15895 [Alkaliphilus serpentinus]
MVETRKDIVKFIRNIIPSDIPETYPVIDMFNSIADSEKIRKGVLAFRELLYMICDRLMDEEELYLSSVKKSRATSFHPSLPVSFPFLNNLKSILYNLGYHGEIDNNSNTLIVNDIGLITSTVGVDGRKMKAKISTPKLIDALKFLDSIGFEFVNLNLDIKPSRMAEIKSIEIKYSMNVDLFVGIKVMSVAQEKLFAKGKHDIFLRCDYREIMDQVIDSYDILNDYLKPLDDKVRNFVLALHRRYTNQNLTCKVDVFYLGVRVIYSYGNNEVWTFSASHNSGYRILIKAQKKNMYLDFIESFPKELKEVISRGYGCNKKLFAEACQKGCHGYSFLLDEAILKIGGNIQTWLDMEVECLKNKGKILSTSS